MSLKYFSEDDEYIKGECPNCGRVLKIKRSSFSSSSIGYNLNPPGIKCFCGVIHNEITGNRKKQSQLDKELSVQPSSKPKYTTNDLVLPIVFIVLIISFLGYIVFGYQGEKDDNSFIPGKADAWVVAEDLIKEQLKAPSTAKFQTYRSEKVTPLSENKYKVSGSVDAENSFGAMIRNNFIVNVEFIKDSSGKWLVRKSIEYLGE